MNKILIGLAVLCIPAALNGMHRANIGNDDTNVLRIDVNAPVLSSPRSVVMQGSARLARLMEQPIPVEMQPATHGVCKLLATFCRDTCCCNGGMTQRQAAAVMCCGVSAICGLLAWELTVAFGQPRS